MRSTNRHESPRMKKGRGWVSQPARARSPRPYERCIEMVERKHRKTAHLWLTLALAVYLCVVTLPATQGFMASDHFNPEKSLRRNLNNLIRRVHKAEWVIGYRYMDNCPPADKK